ncbi:hypothetical protein [Methylorubrum populi]|uniref:hypothetical protein n=1 Tax=Methylorubrum populi TaxID=223967 RepID=UPI0012FFD0DA|nr:hypothetical protein [Methylorubrum populi]
MPLALQKSAANHLSPDDKEKSSSYKQRRDGRSPRGSARSGSWEEQSANAPQAMRDINQAEKYFGFPKQGLVPCFLFLH